jgi:hypothetical protein
VIVLLSVAIATARDVDEEVIVDGEIVSVDLGKKELRMARTNGKKLAFKIREDTEVKLDGEVSTRKALKPGQEVRVLVLKKARETTRIFIYEVTQRPGG